jgi:hypothetical protein
MEHLRVFSFDYTKKANYPQQKPGPGPGTEKQKQAYRFTVLPIRLFGLLDYRIRFSAISPGWRPVGLRSMEEETVPRGRHGL